ncbi:copper amine oxidase N-terminal domain-containing protein [Paenibacillus vini]|uniref:copper amine oxidase N-terminal domain-containing protein n=1 Tax=Paenibacillus vini TaxID=1476024 RepID=UPI0025B64737|nr:copper amine oxidase N-terminal domain-containing protein [Paenibacillus vini]MDN4067628.1 copper amine oxidase N-terminal domain-containing protein [Paenibacillus vini]
MKNKRVVYLLLSIVILLASVMGGYGVTFADSIIVDEMNESSFSEENLSVTEDTYNAELSQLDFLLDDVKLISTASDLDQVRDDLDGDYRLMNNIDLSGVDWTPIGSREVPFTGSFDGNGYTISNLTLDVTDDYYGLFGYIASNTDKLIGNVKLTEVDITYAGNGLQNIGSFAGYVKNEVSRIDVEGVISIKHLTKNLGGIVGSAKKVESSSFTGRVVVELQNAITFSPGVAMGGIAGSMLEGDNLSSSITVQGNSMGYFGGISGQAYVVKNSNSDLTFNIDNSLNYVGGIVGFLPSVINRDEDGLPGYDNANYLDFNNNTVKMSGQVKSATKIAGIIGEIDDPTGANFDVSFNNNNIDISLTEIMSLYWSGGIIGNYSLGGGISLSLTNNSVELNAEKATMGWVGGLIGDLGLSNSSTVILNDNNISMLVNEAEGLTWVSGLVADFTNFNGQNKVEVKRNKLELQWGVKNSMYSSAMIGTLYFPSDADIVFEENDVNLKAKASSSSGVSYAAGIISSSTSSSLVVRNNKILLEVEAPSITQSGGIIGYGSAGLLERNSVNVKLRSENITWSGGLIGQSSMSDSIPTMVTNNDIEFSIEGNEISYAGGVYGYSSGGVNETSKTRVNMTGNFAARVSYVGGIGGYEGNSDNADVSENSVLMDLTWKKEAVTNGGVGVFFGYSYDTTIHDSFGIIDNNRDEDRDLELPTILIQGNGEDNILSDNYIIYTTNDIAGQHNFPDIAESKGKTQNMFLAMTSGESEKFVLMNNEGNKTTLSDLSTITNKELYSDFYNGHWRILKRDGIDVPRLAWQNFGSVEPIKVTTSYSKINLGWTEEQDKQYLVYLYNDSNPENATGTLVNEGWYSTSELSPETTYRYEIYIMTPLGVSSPKVGTTRTLPLPVDPNPVDPTPPVDPKPVDPTPPIDPNPVDPTPPVDPNPVDPTPPVDPNPVDPTTPIDPKPVDPNWTEKPEVVIPVKPTEPSEPVDNTQEKAKTCSPATSNSGKVEVFINCEKVVFPDAQPYINHDSGRVMIPLRFIYESPEIQNVVKWDPTSRTVTTQDPRGNKIKLTIDAFEAVLNNERKVVLEIPPIIQKDRTFLPLRAYMDLLGAKVQWDHKTKNVLIFTSEEYKKSLLSKEEWLEILTRLSFEQK